MFSLQVHKNTNKKIVLNDDAGVKIINTGHSRTIGDYSTEMFAKGREKYDAIFTRLYRNSPEAYESEVKDQLAKTTYKRSLG